MKRLIYQITENLLPPSNLWGVSIYFDLIQYKAFRNNHPFFNQEKKVNDLIVEQILKFETKNFIDIGSNVGIHGFSIAKKFKDLNVFNFEPNPRLIRLQRKTLKKNKIKNLKIFNVALNNNEGFFDFYLDKVSTGESSLVKLEGLTRKIRVQSKRLDQFDFSGCIGMKIDVEGNEFNVIKGIKNFKSIDWIIVEINQTFLSHSNISSIEIIKHLEEKDFKLNLNKSIDNNFLFLKND